MSKIAMVTVPYGAVLEVPFGYLGDILNWTLHETEGYGDDRIYRRSNACVSVEIVQDGRVKDEPAPTAAAPDVNDIPL